MSDLFENLKKMKQKPKKFDDLPDMQVDGEDGLAKFDLVAFKDEGLDGIKKMFARQGKPAPEIKVVGVSVHVVLLNPDDPKREEMAISEIVAWHKKCGDPKKYLAGKFSNMDNEECSCGECEHEKESMDPEEQPYEPKNKYNGMMYG